jgi:hypothetical protein
MPAPTVSALEEKIAVASTLYHRVVVLVGGSSDSRSELLATSSRKHNWLVVDLGLTFSQQLLDVPRRHRAVTAPQVLSDLLSSISNDILLLDHIEILFNPELAQDPIKLLQSLSRNRTLVVSWPGAYDGATLLYAEPGDPEYYRQPIPDLMQVEMSGTADAEGVAKADRV